MGLLLLSHSIATIWTICLCLVHVACLGKMSALRSWESVLLDKQYHFLSGALDWVDGDFVACADLDINAEFSRG